MHPKQFTSSTKKKKKKKSRYHSENRASSLSLSLSLSLLPSPPPPLSLSHFASSLSILPIHPIPPFLSPLVLLYTPPSPSCTLNLTCVTPLTAVCSQTTASSASAVIHYLPHCIKTAASTTTNGRSDTSREIKARRRLKEGGGAGKQKFQRPDRIYFHATHAAFTRKYDTVKLTKDSSMSLNPYFTRVIVYSQTRSKHFASDRPISHSLLAPPPDGKFSMLQSKIAHCTVVETRAGNVSVKARSALRTPHVSQGDRAEQQQNTLAWTSVASTRVSLQFINSSISSSFPV